MMSHATNAELQRQLGQIPQGSKKPVYRWMCTEIRLMGAESFVTSSSAPDINLTYLAEEAAAAFDRFDWLDDENHWVWDCAVAAAMVSR